jgi:hypothetical protein
VLVVWTTGERGCPGHAASVGEPIRERVVRGMPIMERPATSGGGTTTHFDIKRKQSEEAGG